jgi:hypothetical protein
VLFVPAPGRARENHARGVNFTPVWGRGHRPEFFVFFVSLVYTTRLHALFKKADELSHLVIGAAIEVHRLKGPGLLEMKLVDGVVRMILPGANWEA